MKTTKLLWLAIYIVIISVVGGWRALAYTGTPPSIIWLTGSQTNCAGMTVQFSVGAVDDSSYQWSRNGNNLANQGNISGAATATLTISNITVADAGDYSVVVSNPYGGVASGSTHLSVQTDPPAIIVQPKNQAVLLGASSNQLAQMQSPDGEYVGGNAASFSVIATGCTPMGYQWRKNGVNLVNGGNISGANSPNLAINPVTMADAGTYMV